MSRRAIFLASVLAGASSMTHHSIAPAGTQEASADDLKVSTAGWTTDFTRHSVPLSEIRTGGPPRDGIPPIDNPRYVSLADADAWLAASEPVIAVAIERADSSIVARAYPLQLMVWHEIVNDMLGDTHVTVTFCPLCYSAIAYDRRLEPGDTIYDFGTTGNLRHSDLIMWDRQTESWWQQFSGDAIVGELTGAHLTFLPAQIISWSAFKEAYPRGDVLSRETGFNRSYGTNPYPGYDDVNSRPFLFDGSTDERLPAKELVVAVNIGTQGVAYPVPALHTARLVEDTVDNTPIVVLWQPGASSALDTSDLIDGRDIGQVGVFVRELDGRELTFSLSPDSRVIDAETGSSWDITGAATSGTLSGERLIAVPHTLVFWFAWAAFQPRGRLWNPADESNLK